MPASRIPLTVAGVLLLAVAVLAVVVAHVPSRLAERVVPGPVAAALSPLVVGDDAPGVPPPSAGLDLFVQVRFLSGGTAQDSPPVRVVRKLHLQGGPGSLPATSLDALLVRIQETRMRDAVDALGQMLSKTERPITEFQAGLRRRVAADERRLRRVASAIAGSIPAPAGRAVSVRAVVVATPHGSSASPWSAVPEAPETGFSPGLLGTALDAEPPREPFVVHDTGWDALIPGIRAWDVRTQERPAS